MKIDLFLVNYERVRLIQEPEFLVSFCIFWPATTYQLMIKNLRLRLMTWKRVFFIDTSLVSGGCRNPRKLYRPPDSNYWRDNKVWQKFWWKWHEKICRGSCSIYINCSFFVCDLPSLKITSATKTLILKGTLWMLYTNIAKLMTLATVVYVAIYHAMMLSSLLGYMSNNRVSWS